MVYSKEIIDYQDGLKRFCNNKELYESFLLKFFAQETVYELEELLKKKDYQKAFLLSHGLKGTIGNLSITYLYDDVSSLTEMLRNGNPNEEALLAQYMVIKKKYEESKKEMLK